jgi:hypothetical protein
VSSLALAAPHKLAAFPRALIRLCARSQRELLGLRLTRLYGIGIGISYAIVTVALGSDAALAAGLWSRSLQTASWVAGIGALSLARDLRARDELQGLAALTRLRGFSEPTLEHARTLAGALRLSGAVALPGLFVALAAVLALRTLAGAGIALALALFTVPYALLLGSTLALLARLSFRLLPERGRLLFASIALLPWLVALGTHSRLPSLPAAFSWLLRHLVGSLS